jgi:hypothetical protein
LLLKAVKTMNRFAAGSALSRPEVTPLFGAIACASASVTSAPSPINTSHPTKTAATIPHTHQLRLLCIRMISPLNGG